MALLSSAEQGEASSSAPPAQQPLMAGSSIPLADITVRQGTTTDTPSFGNESLGSSSILAEESIKPRELLDYPQGYPRFAVLQALGLNTSIFRSFDLLSHRVFVDQETKISFLGQTLWQLDIEDDRQSDPSLKNLSYDEHFLEKCLWVNTSTTPYQMRSPPCGQANDQSQVQDTRQQSNLKSKDELLRDRRARADLKDRIMEALFRRLRSYHKFALGFERIGSRPKIDSEAYDNAIRFAKGHDSLAGEGWRFLREENASDFFTTQKDRAYEPFEALLYHGGGGIMHMISKLFIRLFQIKNQTATDSNLILINSNILIKLQRAFAASFCSAMLLAPIVVMILVPLSNLQSLGVVVGFVTFMVITLTIKGVKLDDMLIILGAYIAVLGAFFSSLVQSGGR